MERIGTVENISRYPVKSMAGEEVAQAFVGFAIVALPLAPPDDDLKSNIQVPEIRIRSGGTARVSNIE